MEIFKMLGCKHLAFLHHHLEVDIISNPTFHEVFGRLRGILTHTIHGTGIFTYICLVLMVNVRR